MVGHCIPRRRSVGQTHRAEETAGSNPGANVSLSQILERRCDRGLASHGPHLRSPGWVWGRGQLSPHHGEREGSSESRRPCCVHSHQQGTQRPPEGDGPCRLLGTLLSRRGVTSGAAGERRAPQHLARLQKQHPLHPCSVEVPEPTQAHGPSRGSARATWSHAAASSLMRLCERRLIK